jgi:hypothetical protein
MNCYNIQNIKYTAIFILQSNYKKYNIEIDLILTVRKNFFKINKSNYKSIYISSSLTVQAYSKNRS